MNNKNCEEIMNSYLLLDKDEKVPLKIFLHLFFCRKCRQQIKMLSYAEKQIAAPLNIQTPITDDSIKNVMLKIAPEVYEKMIQKPISISGWIAGGIVMIELLFFSIFITKNMHNESISLVYGLLIAALVTGYCALFICSHVDIFVEKISTHIGKEWKPA